MPITITIPAPDAPTGPGFTVAGSTDLIGPIPVDDYWLVRISPSSDDNVTIVYGCRPAAGFNSFNVIIGQDLGCLVSLTVGQPGLVAGIPARLNVSLHHANHAQVESLSIPVVWDPTSMLFKYGDDHWAPATPTSGFTSSDRAILTHADDGIWQRFPHA